MKDKVTIFWFRRDLRIEDNKGLYSALQSKYPVIPIFIFDEDILDELEKDDPRVTFIHQSLNSINSHLRDLGSSILAHKGKTLEVWKNIIDTFDVKEVYSNEDYEPYAITRDQKIIELLEKNNTKFELIKDQVIFAKNEVLKPDGKPYTVFTPYKKKWLSHFTLDDLKMVPSEKGTTYYPSDFHFPTLEEMNFDESKIKVPSYTLKYLEEYDKMRDFPYEDKTSHLSTHLRFGTVSIRQIIHNVKGHDSFLSELIWREFFMQILFHFPKVIDHNFKAKYDKVQWRNNEEEFQKWKEGKTGYPIVDAGMRELNATGFMHNRVRMIVAGFLCKHLLIDWKWGEAYFASKLLDYELSANNGNWQWAAGTGCDAAPYFRVFNPTTQTVKFDKKFEYIRKWVPEFDSLNYVQPMVDHKMARERAIEVYKQGLS